MKNISLEVILDNIHPIPNEDKRLLIDHISAVSYPKGHMLFKAGKTERNLYLIQKGIVRGFSPMDGADVTFWFGEEGDPVLSMKSYVENKMGYENVELLEDCDLFKINIDDLKSLYNSNVCIANWGRKLAEKELLKLESRIISTELLPAKQRYEAIINDSPSLIQRVPLKYISSYLGMTQVSLSRIRKQK